MTTVALDWGARWVVHWQLYNGNGSDKGYGLILPDGEKSPTYRYYQQLIEADRVPARPSYVPLELEFDRLVDDRAFACSELELHERDSGTVRTYDIGTPMAEPLIWSGSFWVDEHQGQTSRWFGGNGGVTRIYVPTREFDGARALRLHGRPREAGIEMTVRVNGHPVDSLRFDENRWRDWTVSLAERTPTPTTASEPPQTSEAPSGTATDRTTTPPGEHEAVPGFGVLAGLAGLGTATYRRYRNVRDDRG